MNKFLKQFSNPQGLMGRFVGAIMARTNTALNDWAISVLDVNDDDDILEIGFGSGIAIAEMRKIAPNGTILGIDHSEAMLKQAYRRNIDAIKRGKVTLVMSDVSDIAFTHANFDKVLSVNSVMFWENPLKTLQSIRNLMKPNGKIVLAAQVRENGPAKMNSEQVGSKVVEYLTEAGYSDVHMYKRDLRPVPAICVVGVC